MKEEIKENWKWASPNKLPLGGCTCLNGGGCRPADFNSECPCVLRGARPSPSVLTNPCHPVLTPPGVTTTWAWDTGPFPTSCEWASGWGYCGDACPSPEVRLLGDGPWFITRLQARWPEQREQFGESGQQLPFQKPHSGEWLFLWCSVCLNVGWLRPPSQEYVTASFWGNWPDVLECFLSEVAFWC